ncbi:DNA polymerase III subunit gamma/tau [Psychrobacter sp. G]|uniref:DNA polymerase III subunit gamma/tau n=1 Tax=Psychrobacter sp. G TaxID=571800 RepID=UPI000354C1B9|nr:DNA polymerase III subunit gamma/tau [Psychrobacter sp. G]AGP48997.1 DNA polymerase III subunit gamma/tau [Psychrobacter sp. G]
MTQQYQVLARKYRPKNFHELIGQTHVSQALINAIDYNRLHHAYLFTGTRGVGKTTIARILSKCLNCDTGITSTPCGVCDNCVAIDQGRFIDLIEIDAASRTKVEDTRELLDNVPYAPSQGRYKVYLIDEVHMLSTHSFNALLKTLEEPPEHVKFLLATTDPQKLPITIISRCLQFVLRPLSQSLLSEHLANVLTQEQVGYTQPALWQLASAAKGSVRDALSLTDQAIAFGQGALDDVTVNSMLGLIDAADLVSLITDIYNHDKPAVAAHIEQMRAQMVDASSMFDGLAELLHQLALCQLLPEVALNVNEAQAQHIDQLAQHMSPDVLQLYYEIVVQAREGVKLASTPMQALEMCILRLLAFRPLPVDEILANVLDSTVMAIEKPTTTVSSATLITEPVSSSLELQTQSDNIVYENTDISVNDKQDVGADNSITQHEQYYSNDEASHLSQYDNSSVYDTLELSNNQPEPVVEPVVEPEVNDSQLFSQSEDPRALLRCPPQELIGEWTPEKWDYWLQTAREAASLAQDELALARQGMMTGSCNAEAIFVTAVDSKHLQATFEQLATKMQVQFPDAAISLRIDSSIAQADDKTPERRQQKRLVEAKTVAESRLFNTPVMQYLTERGEGKMGKVQLY